MPGQQAEHVICKAIGLLQAQFSSVQDGIYSLGKSHMRSTPFLMSFTNVAVENWEPFIALGLRRMGKRTEKDNTERRARGLGRRPREEI